MAQPDLSAAGATLTVAFVVGVTPGKWARTWAERMPRTALQLRLCSASEALVAVSEGSVDAALMRLPIDDEHLSRIPLYSELSVVVAPKEHAIDALDSVTLADLVDETVFQTGPDGSWVSIIELIATGAGVAVMPQSVARALSRRDIIARPVSDGPTSRIALAWLATNNSTLVEEFIGIVRGRTANSSRGAQAPPEKKSRPVAKRTPDRRPSRRR
jgi:DNA-binding transcriptional LysR family regulator